MENVSGSCYAHAELTDRRIRRVSRGSVLADTTLLFLTKVLVERWLRRYNMLRPQGSLVSRTVDNNTEEGNYAVYQENRNSHYRDICLTYSAGANGHNRLLPGNIA